MPRRRGHDERRDRRPVPTVTQVTTTCVSQPCSADRRSGEDACRCVPDHDDRHAERGRWRRRSAPGGIRLNDALISPIRTPSSSSSSETDVRRWSVARDRWRSPRRIGGGRQHRPCGLVRGGTVEDPARGTSSATSTATHHDAHGRRRWPRATPACSAAHADDPPCDRCIQTANDPLLPGDRRELQSPRPTSDSRPCRTRVPTGSRPRRSYAI